MTLPRLIIGERDPFMRRTLEGVLASRFDLTFAGDGEELLHLTRAQPPDLIVLEALLPRKDGFQVCRELKQDPAASRIPILCFTILLAEERARLAGADAFLLKPLREEQFLETIQQLLKKENG
jgi:CheY-like chemotaxis protein